MCDVDKDKLEELAYAASFAGFVLDNKHNIVKDPESWDRLAEDARTKLHAVQDFIMAIRFPER